MKVSERIVSTMLMSLLLFSISYSQSSVDPTHPNILLIIADDLGIDPVPGYPGTGEKAQMPHLESLMSSGLVFDNAWSQPSCSPTRASILTGKYGRANGVNMPGDQLSPSEISLHTYIEETSQGMYSSSLIGKWHLGGNNNPNYPTDSLGIPYYAGILGGGVRNYERWELAEDGQITSSTEYVTSKLTDLAIDWINDQDSPWFCWLAYNAPHTPYHLPPTTLHQQDQLSGTDADIESNPFPYYIAALEALDTEMGRLLSEIPSDILANTTVIFIGDNGTPNAVLQDPFSRRQGKGSLNQGGINVPLVVAHGGVSRSGEREDALVGVTDLFATITRLSGVEVDQVNDSFDFSYLLANTGESRRSCNYADRAPSDGNTLLDWTARDSIYKLIVSDDEQTFEFYNLLDDPSEDNNLIRRNLTEEQQLAFDVLREGCLTIATSSFEIDDLLVELYPNPVDGMFTISGLSENYHIQIIDAHGQVLRQLSSTSLSTSVDISDLPDGPYFVSFINASNKLVHLESIIKM